MEMRVHLKVCEGCGCLWYRANSEVRVYCFGCYERLKEFPTVKGRQNRGRPRKAILPTVLAVDATGQTDASLPGIASVRSRSAHRHATHRQQAPSRSMTGGAQ